MDDSRPSKQLRWSRRSISTVVTATAWAAGGRVCQTVDQHAGDTDYEAGQWTARGVHRAIRAILHRRRYVPPKLVVKHGFSLFASNCIEFIAAIDGHRVIVA